MEGAPLDSHVTAYHPGRSDIHEEAIHPQAEPAAEKPETLATRITSIFKKTSHEADYPPRSEPYAGPLAHTQRRPELEAVPVEQRIERIHKG